LKLSTDLLRKRGIRRWGAVRTPGPNPPAAFWKDIYSKYDLTGFFSILDMGLMYYYGIYRT
jgi:hypothetical protein